MQNIIITAVHPGVWLKKNFIAPAGITVKQLSEETGLSDYLLGLIVEGEYTISEHAAQVLASKFGFDPAKVLAMQAEYDEAYKLAAAAQ